MAATAASGSADPGWQDTLPPPKTLSERPGRALRAEELAEERQVHDVGSEVERA